jgi:hypothetical protein
MCHQKQGCRDNFTIHAQKLFKKRTQHRSEEVTKAVRNTHNTVFINIHLSKFDTLSPAVSDASLKPLETSLYKNLLKP